VNPDIESAGWPIVADNCTGCGTCVPACPTRALSLASEHPGGLGRKSVTVDAARCTGCGICLPACPRQALITPPL
jgi:ferredoxin